MAMIRSSIKGMWNLSCEGSTHLYTGAKMGKSLMFGTWRRGLMSLLVLASLPFLAPVILVSMMVGGIFLVPILCGVTAYCALFRPTSLSNFIKWFRPPKSVVRSGPPSAELVMEDLDVDSEYVIVTNETDQDEPQEFDVSSALLNASVVEIEAFELRSPSRSTAENIFEEPDAFEAVPVTEEDKVAALIAVKSMQDDEVRSLREGSTMDIEVEPHPEQILGSDTIAREVDAADSDERATMVMEDKQQGEDDEVVNDRELNESDLPAFEHVKTLKIVDHQDLSALKQVEEPNRLDERLAEAQSAYEEPAASEEPEYFVESKAVLIAREQLQLEEPEFLNEGTTEAQSASEALKTVGELENLDSEVVEEKEDEGHTLDQLKPGKEEKRFDEYNKEIRESGQTMSASTQPFLSEGKFEHSEHVPPLNDAVQQVDDFAATEGDSEPNYESAPDSFSPSENEQEQVDAIESKGRKLTEDTAHGLEGHTELNLKGVDAKEVVSVDEVDALVIREKEDELPVSEPTSEKEVPGLEEGAVIASALEPVALVIEEKTLPVEEVVSMADVAPVEVAASSVEEAMVKKTSEPASQVVEQEEVEAPARAPEVMKEVGAPVFEDIYIVEPETTKEPDVDPAAPQVLIEGGAGIAQEKGIDIPLVVSEPTSEEKDVSAVEVEDVPALSLKSEVLITEQHPLPVESEGVDSASPVADVPAIADAAPAEAVASAEDSDANDLYKGSAPVVEEREKSSAPMEDVIPERVEDLEAPVLAAKGAETFVKETAASEASVPIAEPEATKEVEGKLADVSVGLAKEMGDSLLESTSSIEEQHSLPVDSEPVELASRVAAVPAIAEAAPVQEASFKVATLVKESDAKEAGVAEAPMLIEKVVGSSLEEAGTSEADSLIVEPDVAREAAAESAAPEVGAEEEIRFVQEEAGLPLVASEPVLEESEVPVVEEKDARGASLGSETSTKEEHFLPVDSELVDVASPVADVPAIEEAALMEEAVPDDARGVKVEFPQILVVESKDMEAPVAALEKLKVEESPVVVAPAQAGLAPVTEVPIEEKETPVVAELAPALESEPVVVVVEKSQLEEAAPGEDTAAVGEGVVEEGDESEASEMDVKEMKAPMVTLQETPAGEDAAPEAETPMVDVKGTKESGPGPAVPEAFVEKAQTLEDKVELPLVVSEPTFEAPQAEALVNEPEVTKDSAPAFTAAEEASDVREVERLEANGEPMQEGHYRIASNLEPSSNIQDSMAVGENLNQASQDRSVNVLDMDREDTPFVSSSSSQAQCEEQGNIANEDTQKLEENFDKDKVVGSHTEQDVFPTLKPLNIIESKESAYDEAKKSAPAQRRISFEGVGADDDVNMGASPSSSQGTGVQGTNSVLKSYLGRYHRTHRHSAPDFLGTHTWVREAPFYSPQESFRGHKKAKHKRWPELEGARPAGTFSGAGSDSGESHMGEFEGLLQSWQGRDRARHSRTSVSPSNSPRSPAEIGRQIREEISTIQKIIGQEIPPQYSLWKEVETLSQIVGMELPYMGDVSDLTKARHGLDLLKVVVGIK